MTIYLVIKEHLHGPVVKAFSDKESARAYKAYMETQTARDIWIQETVLDNPQL
jgi:hypothetical protein